MGTTCACQKVESEEETIETILCTMPLNEINTNTAYTEFLQCIKNNHLDFFLFQSYLEKIIGENIYSKVQFSLFNTIYKRSDNQENIKKIGSMIIFLSKGSNSLKINTLFEHFNKFYFIKGEKELKYQLKEFITDIVDYNTDNCLLAIQDSMEYEGIKTISNIWRKNRKRALIDSVYANYESLNRSFDRISSHRNLRTEHFHRVHTLGDYDDEMNLRKGSGITETKRLNTELNYTLNTHQNQNQSESEKSVPKEFFELSFSQLKGSYIRNYLYEEYMKEKTYDRGCF
jgi:hypothetical protein